jgi:TolB-like protein/DNA-binding winged helix-turn-helix (wHTH) protein/cytochrome c-type biogenesis protein CcmH/NrfG
MRRQSAGDFAGLQAKLAESRHMDALGSLGRFAFEGFRFDLAAGGLFRTNGEGAAEPVALSSRAVALLALLVERHGQLVSKDEIFAVVWPGSIVGEGNLTVQISALRRVLDDARPGSSCIQTVAGRGYRFVLPVTRRKMAATRRLAAILAADVAGYSRLIGSDEPGTLARLKTIRSELIDPSIASHNGRIVKTTGDGLLAEFVSSVDALNCAQETQVGLGKLNAELTPEDRIELRIGIHQGDIIVEDGDIFGDGVNIAARLEGLAEPGGICVSARVQEDAAGKLDLAFRDLGEQQLKNIVRPVRAYAVDAERRPSLAGNRANSVPRISVVVLPFNNLSNDPEQQYFVDGITEDLTTDLSRIEGFVVISRNTAFTYKGKSVDAKQIGRELDVRYILEGSVRKVGRQIRVNVQLIDAETATGLWAERFDGDAHDLFAMQDEITTRFAVALKLELVDAEAARPSSTANAVDCILRGRSALNRPFSPENYAEAIGQFERALTFDPGSVEAQSRLATTLTHRVLNFFSFSSASDVDRADTLAAQAIATSPRSAVAHFAKAQVLRVQGRYREAIREYETVLALDRNMVEAFANIGRCKIFTGPIDEAIVAQEEAIRLSPRDPQIPLWYYRIGQAHLLQSRIGEAIAWLERACAANPAPPFLHAYLASAFALGGESERAAAELAAAATLTAAAGREPTIAGYRRGFEFALPEIRARVEATFFEGLRRAGMREE